MKKPNIYFRIMCVVLAALCVSALASCRRDEEEPTNISTFVIGDDSYVGIPEPIEVSENYIYSFFNGHYTDYEDPSSERWVIDFSNARTTGIEKLRGEVRTDLIQLKNTDIDGLFQKDGKCVAYGTKRMVYTERPWLMLVDESGGKLEKVLDLPDTETIVTVIDDGGSGYYILTSINKNEPYVLQLRISHITERGQFTKNPSVRFKVNGYKGIVRNFGMCEDGFTVTVEAGHYLADDNNHYSAVAFNKNGGLLCNYMCGAQEGTHEIRSAVIRNGVLYLSGVVYEKESERSSIYSYFDEAELLQYETDYGYPFYSNETVANVFKKALSAFLVEVDLESGQTLKYFKESGAIGGVLHDDGNAVVWDLCVVSSSAFYSPLTSSFNFECLCGVVQCRIGADGEIADKTVTDLCVSETF